MLGKIFDVEGLVIFWLVCGMSDLIYMTWSELLGCVHEQYT